MRGIKIKNYSNYWIFPELGMIWSNPRNTTRGGWVGKPMNDGYHKVGLIDDNGNIWKTSVHKVIYTAVHGEIPEGLVINHKDENPSNNSIWNLEICTQKENVNWGTSQQRRAMKRSRQVERCDLQGNVVERFSSTMEAGRSGYNQSAVSRCCNNSYGELGNVYKGSIFRYKAA